MADDNTPAAPTSPSVFISYAAADRAAARALRETLATAGLDVWYDESELGGGDAWDQKIRRQIRDCDYFMPLISANTEARKEGYFRREWRLATERTLDMADDVLFLLPVALDDTPEQGARVPEKFLSVQWLRAPGGQPTPALRALLSRLRAGDHQALPRTGAGPARAATHGATQPAAPFLPGAAPPPPPPSAAGIPPEAPVAPPPMPPFPHVPEKGGFFHGIKFLAEVLWWAITGAWTIFVRLPRWARVVIGIWILLMLFSPTRCSRPTERTPNSTASRSGLGPGRGGGSGGGEGQKKMRQILERVAQSARESGTAVEGFDLAKLSSEIAQVFGEGYRDGPAFGKHLVVIPFSRPDDETAGGRFAHAVFLSLYGRLALDRRSEVGVAAPLRSDPLPSALPARAAVLGAEFVLAASLEGEGNTTTLQVRLFSAAESKIVWSESYPLTGSDETTVAERIASQVLEKVPRRGPRRPKSP